MRDTTLVLDPVIRLQPQQFQQLCEANPDMALELTAQGDLVIMAPIGGDGGYLEAGLIGRLWLWNESRSLGFVFSSSTLFQLPNGSVRGPDVAWIPQERWQSLTPEQQRGFPPICPDFVIELRSPSQSAATLGQKMQEYLENGTQLGWLVDPLLQQVQIYRPGCEVQTLPYPVQLSGDPILPGFVLDWP